LNHYVGSGSTPWWKGASIYQIYPRSFYDSTGDGTGDLIGIKTKLEYVAELGVDAIWVSPFFQSPMADFGYDISDYKAVDPMFGTLDDFSLMLAEAHRLGLKVIIDQVLSHTSDQHAWFAESRSNKSNAKSDWYVWADAKPDGTAPNNWLSLFGGQAWTWDSRREQYYLHNFLRSQPDLNFYNPEVRAAQLENAKFWLELGVDGFRFDVVNFYYHDRHPSDNPPVSVNGAKPLGVSSDNPYGRQQHKHDISQPENLRFLADLRILLDAYDDSTSVGEISDDTPLATMSAYTSGGDKLHMAYTFDLLSEQFSAQYVRDVIRNIEASIGDGWPCWAISNHDVARHSSRWGHESCQDFARMTLTLLLSMRGSVCLYQGDELGLPQAHVPYESLKDPYGFPFWPEYQGRDGCRTPMPWENSLFAGFSESEPWLPIPDQHRALSVASQQSDDKSVLAFSHKLLKWRKELPALVYGTIELVEDEGDVLSWVRSTSEQSLLVVINVSAREQSYPLRCERFQRVDELGFTSKVSGDSVCLPPFQAAFFDLSDEKSDE